MASTWMARGQVAKRGGQGLPTPPPAPVKGQLARGPVCGKRATRLREESESFVLRTSIVGEVGVKKIHSDWWVQVMQLPPGDLTTQM